MIWDPEKEALFAAAILFWIGSRSLAKVRQGGEPTGHVTQAGLNFIKRAAGFDPMITICPGGHPTIGYGHVRSRLGVQGMGVLAAARQGHRRGTAVDRRDAGRNGLTGADWRAADRWAVLVFGVVHVQLGAGRAPTADAGAEGEPRHRFISKKRSRFLTVKKSRRKSPSSCA
jgi:hypothetical protein